MSISIEEFKKLKEINLIDVREVDEYKSGHVENAKNLPLSVLPFNYQEHFNSNDTYYIMCHAGGRSANACSFLRKQGIKVVNVEGGYVSYNA